MAAPDTSYAKRTPPKKRTEPAVVKSERAAFDSSRSVNPYEAVVRDIMTGSQELKNQGQAAWANIQAGYRKIKRFVQP
jgi:hypothetical protein